MEFDRPVEVKVWGDYACFTRPEMRVERVSYPTVTPSAARGILESIFWRPEFTWNIREIDVLEPIKYFAILRNEVNSRISERSAKSWVAEGGGYRASQDRAQRNTVALANVAYVIRADVTPHNSAPGLEAKYRDQFRRRVSRGQCFARPYLGTREFAAHFSAPTPEDRPTDISMELGRMLRDLDYQDGKKGDAIPVYFDAVLEHGVLVVPPLEFEAA